MDQLTAINRILRAVGELPVPLTIDIDDLPDGHEAKTAKEILEEVNKELQENGLWFNRETITYTPIDDTITFSEDVITVSDTSGRNTYTIRSNELYDITNNTAGFTADLDLLTVTEITFTDVPAIFATLVVYVASRELHQFLNADTTVAKDIKENIYKQTIKVDREDMKNNKYNLIKGSRIIDRTANRIISITS